jgi:mannose-6-phosphate isomerase-like protein (cupin superfamily)
MIDRRGFAAGIPALLALGKIAEAQASAKPPAVKTGQEGHTSQAFTTGLLPAGNIRLEMHESTQLPGAPHEAVGTHKHSEIWYVKTGVATLFINGTEHRMEAGDVGLVCAGDQHWIANAGKTELSYFVITVGPPE